MSPYRAKKIEIGKLLLEKGLISYEQLQEALAIQREKEKDKRLGQILIELGYLNREELYFALAVQLGYPFIDIKRCEIDQNVISLMPEVMARKYKVFPIDKIQDVLTLAMVNPLDNVAITEIQDIVKSNIKVFLTTSEDLDELFMRHYKKVNG